MRSRLTLVCLLCLPACAPPRAGDSPPPDVAFVDEVGPPPLFTIDLGPATSDVMRDPYVFGSTIVLDVESYAALDDAAFAVDWSLRSSDEGVVRIGARGAAKYGPTWTLALIAGGTAELQLVDGHGTIVHRRTVTVRKPDRVELSPYGPTLVGAAAAPIARRMRTGASLEGTTARGPHVLRGGTVTFEARYFEGADELHGVGVLTAKGSAGLSASVLQDLWGDTRDWLQVEATSGSGTVELEVGGEPLRGIVLDVVDDLAIDHVELVGEPELGAQDGATLHALAQALTADGEPIYGVDYDFSAFKGDPVKACPSGSCRSAGIGDLYAYTFAAGQSVTLEASHEGLAAQLEIHSGGGTVADTATYGIGCTTAARAPGAAAAPIGLALALLAIARRRRLRRSADA